MENASNALLMAASVLISIMLISLGTYLFATFGNYSKQINTNLSQTQIDEFNNQFTKYEGAPCSPHDVVTLVNLAKDINEKNEYEKGQDAYVNIYAKGNKNVVTETSKTDELNNFIKNNTNNDGSYTMFTCNIETDSSIGLVTKVTFTEK